MQDKLLEILEKLAAYHDGDSYDEGLLSPDQAEKAIKKLLVEDIIKFKKTWEDNDSDWNVCTAEVIKYIEAL